MTTPMFRGVVVQVVAVPEVRTTTTPCSRGQNLRTTLCVVRCKLWSSANGEYMVNTSENSGTFGSEAPAEPVRRIQMSIYSSLGGEPVQIHQPVQPITSQHAVHGPSRRDVHRGRPSIATETSLQAHADQQEALQALHVREVLEACRIACDGRP